MATKTVMAFFIAVSLTKAVLNFAGVDSYSDIETGQMVGQAVAK
jgi:hypothetical protein